ncbi:AbrB/MazE/SpoVT family DNA-binding domain-containing protein [Candidatus Woesearchaeota archaeon]|nr:AbrB/MazE/SpoVT family DNA-binding domain-containing protein [Candidatus Woesearchaeota archaeon]
MKRIMDNFQGFKVNAWQLRIPKSIEQIYNITKGKKIEFELEPETIRLKI